MLPSKIYVRVFLLTALLLVLLITACGSETGDNGEQGSNSGAATRSSSSGNSTPVLTTSQKEPGGDGASGEGAESGLLAGLLEMGSPESPEPLSPGQESTSVPPPTPETIQETESADQETAEPAGPESTPTQPTTITAIPDGMPGILGEFKSVSVGAEYTCVIADDETLECWGSNRFGLDNPPEGEYAQVSTGSSRICLIKVDGNTTTSGCDLVTHACAISSDGDVTCWGDLSLGQGQVPRGKYLSVSAGGAHSCGLRTDFTVACWGYNAEGQANAPSGTFTSVSAGGAHSCAIRDSGSMECWGGGASAGNSTVTCRVDSQGNANCDWEAAVGSGEVPAQVMAPEGTFKAVASGSTHNCAIRTDGSLHCWGDLPVEPQIDPDARFVFVDVGWTNTCALTEDGTPHCWGGSWGGYAQLNDNHDIHYPTDKFESISAGAEHHCGITSEGSLYCWGFNAFGQVVRFEGRHKAVTISGGKVCSIREDGSVGCWPGYGSQLTTAIGDYSLTGQHLPDGYQDGIKTPEGAFSQLGVFYATSTGDPVTYGPPDTCGLKEDGSVHCWTSDRGGFPPGVPLVTLEGAYLAVSPANRLCGARAEGGVVCWGWDNATSEPVAQEISDMTGTYIALSSGWEHICGIQQDGRVECSESAESVLGPTRANPPDGRFISISADDHHTCGVRDDGKLECWGWYQHIRNIPESGNFVQVVSSVLDACALSLDGSVVCWEGSLTSSVDKSFESISLVYRLACGVLRDGRISCWRP